MKIAILSGGSGNDALVKGLMSTFGDDTDIKIIVNAYDSGKSTGVCRKVTNTLGVSDIRKNHVRQLKALDSDYNRSFAEFLESRYDIPKENRKEFVRNKLEFWGLSELAEYSDRFFDSDGDAYEYNDFCIGNIVYAQMFKELGYESTNTMLSKIIGFPDNVILNSFDNVYINAWTENGHILDDEGLIVEYKNEKDPIKSLRYISTYTPIRVDETIPLMLNEKAIRAVEEADYIIISTGTFWSSIFPTLEYGKFYKFINNSNAKKLWAMNTIFDKDSYGCGSRYFLSKAKELGLNLDDFTILLNDDAVDLLKEESKEIGAKYMHAKMGNNNGKHDPKLFAKNIIKAYYGMDYKISDFDAIYVDFDDTLWARDQKLLKVSKDNIKKINEINTGNKFTIVSGNSYESIQKKLYTVFGSDLKEFNIPVWADCATTLYIKNHPIKKIDIKHTIEISDIVIDRINELLGDVKDLVEVKKIVNGFGEVVNVKIRGLEDTVRKLLHQVLEQEFGKVLDVKMTGKTTIDITAKFLNKTYALIADGIVENEDIKTLYIGDEFDSGNDKEISEACSVCLHTNGALDTAIFLELLTE